MNLPTTISDCHKLIMTQQGMIEKLLVEVQKVAKLEEKIKELEVRVNQNSSNSHRPPSSDGLKKPPSKPAFPRKSGKKQGGQSGHKGRTLELIENPDHTIIHSPSICSCGTHLEQTPKSTKEKRQVFNLPQPKLAVTEHQIESCTCPNCGQLNIGSFLF